MGVEERYRWQCLAQYVIAKDREGQKSFYRRWRRRHGKQSAARLVTAIREEQQKREDDIADRKTNATESLADIRQSLDET